MKEPMRERAESCQVLFSKFPGRICFFGQSMKVKAHRKRVSGIIKKDVMQI